MNNPTTKPEKARENYSGKMFYVCCNSCGKQQGINIDIMGKNLNDLNAQNFIADVSKALANICKCAENDENNPPELPSFIGN